MQQVMEEATLGGGCFWCLEAVFGKLRGVELCENGYSGGADPKPTYEKVCSGRSGHVEVVRLRFDPATISFDTLLDVFFTIHDPTTLNRQGHDVGTQYRSGIYFTTPEQAAEARALIDELTQAGAYPRPIVTEVLPLANYHPAEGYHQDFFARNPGQGYCLAVAAPKVAKFRQTWARLAR